MRGDSRLGILVLLLYFTVVFPGRSGLPPVLNVQPLSQTVSLTDSVVFSVEANGGGSLLSYQWLKNGTNISGATASTYTIGAATKADAGTYVVKVTNGSGTVSSSNAVLTVLGAPEISTQPATQTAIPGNNLTLSVAATGAFPLSYKWFFNNTALNEGTNSVFVRSNFNATFAGNYYVVVSNRFGSATSAVATVIFRSWVATYNGTANDHDYLQAIAVDSSGNVYATGYAKETASSSYDYVTLKYDRKGNLLWRAVYNNHLSGDDKAVALAVDAQGNVYVTGSSQLDSKNGGWDYLTIKYDSNGNPIWINRYNGVDNKDDFAVAIALDKDGNVIVTGSGTTANRFQYATVKYDSSGNQLWLKTYSGGTIEDDAISLAVDAAGNIYVTGKSKGLLSGFDYATVKYSSSGTQLWATRYSGTLLKDDVPTKVAVDSSGNCYVTGSSETLLGNVDYLTIKYDLNGNQSWVATYNGTANRADIPSDIAVDKNGNVFVTGTSVSTDSKGDYATVKYSPDGKSLWVSRFDGGDDDAANALVLDSAGNVYVTGQSKFPNTGYDCVTVKYSGATGTEQWNTRYNSAENFNDSGIGLALQDDFTLIVGAQANSKLDYTLIKYQFQVALPVISAVPQNQTVVSGQSAALTVTATGTQPFTYQWNRNGTPIPGATNATLNFQPASSADSGNYTVTIANDFGSITSGSATLTVTIPPILLSASQIQPNGLFGFGTSVPQGATYIVMASTNGIHWMPVATNSANTANPVFFDPETKTYPHRFYRLQVK